jgi:hypothetical protein
MQVQHSPAPWSYDSDVICDANGHDVCVLYTPDVCGDPTVDRPAWRQAHANGRLIAAAPTLLRACRAAIAYWDSKFAENREEALRIIGDAIANADGQR